MGVRHLAILVSLAEPLRIVLEKSPTVTLEEALMVSRAVDQLMATEAALETQMESKLEEAAAVQMGPFLLALEEALQQHLVLAVVHQHIHLAALDLVAHHHLP
jgi:uncharacterized HAD superfamily protein